MSTTYVVIDLETTGLDAHRDAIIEIAAVTFQGNEVLNEFSSLVYPQQKIPDYITELTGIDDKMVADAPSLTTLRVQMRRILGDNILVGHNIGFDLGFLHEAGLGLGNHALDTLKLASILVPEAGRYNLESLVQTLGLPDPGQGQAHRALEDAIQTVELFLALQERALALNWGALEEIVLAGRRLGWPETFFFEEVLAQKAKDAFSGREQRGRLTRLYNPPKLTGQIPVPSDEPAMLDVHALVQMMGPTGNFSRVFAGFELREQQVDMMVAVAEAFNAGEHLLVEAGTGTGKSVGYLLPASFWANQNGRRVVISTNTINLQDQLVNKDIPELQKVLPFTLRAAVRKGRRNYICTRLFQQMRHSGPSSDDEMQLFARILLWLPHTEAGDVAELNLRTQGERQAWNKLSGENAVCTTDHCQAENCPLNRTRMKAEQAHLVIVNHSLLLSDVANNGHILPDFVDLIIDEAHHLESAVTDGLSFRADKRSLEAIFDEITKPRAGMVADLQSRVRAAVPAEIAETMDGYVDGLRRDAATAVLELDEFFTTLDYFLQGQISGHSQYAQQVRLVSSVRSQPDYDHVAISWDNLNNYLKALSKAFEKLSQSIADITASFDIEDGEELRLALASNGRSLEEIRVNLDGILAEPHEGMIYWAEVYKNYISLHAAPLNVGPLVEQHIFGAKETVILTSATMRTADVTTNEGANFEYIRQRLHAHEATELAVGSPFDYKNRTLLYLATDIPEPNQPGYQRYVEEAITELALTLGGRTMVLFTSYGQLSQTAKAIEGPLARAGIATLAQLQGASRQQLLDQFKQPGSRSVLLGTRSFWEGVDVPGEALQGLILTKFPFDVPSDPIFAARSETFDNSFFQYSIPEAVLRFRQGFGRLNRRQTDEGVVLILDKRIVTKRYGQLFLDALPDCMVVRQRIGRLRELTLRWLSQDRNRNL
ncbi:MAG: DEAD/DEAH box helicase family protein [Ardenticatenaceae bacterium]|nr:DEAD/DEAH box helicase family protein [Ardenticatenaceae bacterium]